MNESTTRIDNSGLYAARWLVLLERLGLPQTAPVADVLAAYPGSSADIFEALKNPAAVRLNILAGRITKPDDLVWLYDDNTPVADLAAVAERAYEFIGLQTVVVEQIAAALGRHASPELTSMPLLRDLESALILAGRGPQRRLNVLLGELRDQITSVLGQEAAQA
jgi:hypothetical protein